MTDQSENMATKRGPGRPPKVAEPKNESAREPGEVMVTYIPQREDPAETLWNGHRFVANVPRPVKDERMIEQAKGNPWFEVEGHDKDAAAASAAPKDSEGYRHHAVGWFKATDWYSIRDDQSRPQPNSLEFEERWNNEEKLREACGVGTDDLEYLNKLYTPRLAELKKAES